MANDGIPFIASIGFSITTKCPLACAHCIIEAGPRRKEEMVLDDARRWLREAAAYRNGYIKSVVFTGGEPFQDLSRLKHLLEYAAESGLVAAVVTNCYWAETLPKAVEVLQNLPQIRMLGVSVDAYHQRFVPFENVRNVIRAARELGIRFNAAMCFENENAPPYLDLRSKLEEIIDKELIRASAVFPAGRARKETSRNELVVTPEPPSGPCTAADFPTIFPDGRVIGCMGIVEDLPKGHPLCLGNIREETLAQLLDRAETDVALHILRLWGPGRLIQLLAEAGFKNRLPRHYVKHGYCDLCYAVASDRELREGLNKLCEDNEIVQKTAYARLYYLDEVAMLDRLNERGELIPHN
jgi:organic radical activating enzyme